MATAVKDQQGTLLPENPSNDASQGESAASGLIPQARMVEVQALIDTAEQSRKALSEATNDHMRSFLIAHATIALRKRFTPGIMADLRQLMNTPLGFRTDKPEGPGYPDIVVQDVAIQALIRGLRFTDNEFNIISKNLYITKNGLKRLIMEFPGLQGFTYDVGVPKKVAADGALVPAKATWWRNGREEHMECSGDYAIPVRINDGMGMDAIIGKAESKLWKRVYNRLLGTELLNVRVVGEDPDEIDGEVVSRTSEKTTDASNSTDKAEQ